MEDLNTNNIESAQKMVAGTARSMGIKVSNDKTTKKFKEISKDFEKTTIHKLDEAISLSQKYSSKSLMNLLMFLLF